MAGRDRCSLDGVGPGLPEFDGLVPVGDGARGAPEHEGRAEDASRAAVGSVVLVVERGGSAVLLADGMDGLGGTELGEVPVADVGWEGFGRI
jgi:hypothetical protein